MRIDRHTAHGVVLRGVPFGPAWMMFGTLLGAALLAICGLATRAIVLHGSWSLIVVALGAGVFGLVFFLFCADKLLSVERLELARDGPGQYLLRSRVYGTRTRLQFDRGNVHSVCVTRTRERRSQGRGPAREVERVEATLRLTGPRRTIELDSTENGRDARVLALAREVARAVDLPLTDERGRPLDDDAPSTTPVHAAGVG